MNKLKWFRFVAPLMLLSLFACAAPVRQPESVLDSPAHHYRNGVKFVDRGELDSAQKEFTMANELDPKYSPAYVGFALVSSQKGDYDQAFKHINKAESYAESKDDKVLAKVGKIRVYSSIRNKDWLEDAEDVFSDGLKINPNDPALYYYMGKAHKVKYQFDKAADEFKKVLDINKDYVAEANQEWQVVQMIQRAAPGSLIGKEIALLEKVDRADMAALFIQELNLDKLLKGKTKKFDTGFKPPEGNEFTAQTMVKAPAATDIDKHTLKADIDEAMKLNLRGLTPFPDHTFRPDEPITRADYAVMVEDIILSVSQDKELATKFIGAPSPFPDIRNDHWAFNAIMTATSRGIMQAKDMTSGEFRPQDSVSGAEALLIIRQIKENLKF